MTVLDHPAPLTVSSLVVNRQDAHLLAEFPEAGARDPQLATVLPDRVLNVQVSGLAGRRILLGYRTTNGRMTLGVGADPVLDSESHCLVTGSADGPARCSAGPADWPPCQATALRKLGHGRDLCVERAALANAEIRAAIAEAKAGDRAQPVTRPLPEPDGEAGA